MTSLKMTTTTGHYIFMRLFNWQLSLGSQSKGCLHCFESSSTWASATTTSTTNLPPNFHGLICVAHLLKSMKASELVRQWHLSSNWPSACGLTCWLVHIRECMLFHSFPKHSLFLWVSGLPSDAQQNAVCLPDCAPNSKYGNKERKKERKKVLLSQ